MRVYEFVLVLLVAACLLVREREIALAGASSWRCGFQEFGEPLTFIDLGNGRGKVVGNIGTSDVWVVTGSHAVSFLEPLPSGTVQVTTIVLGTGEAAHSRNTLMPNGVAPEGESNFVPSQFRGLCIPWQ
jgi:hypothetical protein